MSSGEQLPHPDAALSLNKHISTYTATEDTTETVLLSAHYDSRGSFGSTRAPGGDDDGSGTTALLAIARTIARKGVTFRKNVQLVAFSGEEQGLLGSKAYAREYTGCAVGETALIAYLGRRAARARCKLDTHDPG